MGAGAATEGPGVVSLMDRSSQAHLGPQRLELVPPFAEEVGLCLSLLLGDQFAGMGELVGLDLQEHFGCLEALEGLVLGAEHEVVVGLLGAEVGGGGGSEQGEEPDELR